MFSSKSYWPYYIKMETTIKGDILRLSIRLENNIPIQDVFLPRKLNMKYRFVYLVTHRLQLIMDAELNTIRGFYKCNNLLNEKFTETSCTFIITAWKNVFLGNVCF